MSEETKTCSLCLRVLPRTQFHKNGRYLASRCKECTNEGRRAQYTSNPGRQMDANRRWRQAHQPPAPGIASRVQEAVV